MQESWLGLMKHVTGQDDRPGGPQAGQQVSSPVFFDLGRVERLSQSQRALVTSISADLARAVAAGLSISLRADIVATLVEVRDCSFAEFADSLPEAACAAFLRVGSGGEHSIVEIDGRLVPPVVDLLLGGDGRVPAEGREITEVEQNLMAAVFRVLANALEQTWNAVTPISFTFQALEAKPSLSARIPRAESLVVASIEMQAGGTSGLLRFAVPVSVLDKGGQSMAQFNPRGPESGATEAAIKRRLARDLTIALTCDLRGAAIRFRDVLELQPGEVIDLGIPFGSTATVALNGAARFKATVSGAGAKLMATIDGPSQVSTR